MRVIKVPQGLVEAPNYQRDLKFNGITIVESCAHTQKRHGTMFLDDHMLLIVLEGTNTFKHGKSEYVVHKNEMVILKKATLVTYEKTGNPDHDDIFDSMMFFLKDEFLVDFMKMAKIETVETTEMVRVNVKPVKDHLMKFFESIQPYFHEPEKIDGGLVKLKMLELLYDLALTDKNLLLQLLQLKRQVYADIPAIMEANYANPISIADLAYLSGRSLSAFKRDFFAIYQFTPAQWIREKRLAKAKEMLTTEMPVSDICYSLGFESVSHFSRLFKSYYGITPSSLKTDKT